MEYSKTWGCCGPVRKWGSGGVDGNGIGHRVMGQGNGCKRRRSKSSDEIRIRDLFKSDTKQM